jgi:tRNA-splicing ligase RtcB
MIACRLSLNANDIDEQSILRIYNQIHRDVPVGRNQHESDRALTDIALPFQDELKVIIHKNPRLRKAFRNIDNWIYQMGTLGSGNHFIEICLDEAQHAWVMLHSGSRGIGNAIGSYFIERAKKDMLKWDVHLPDTDLAYLQEGSVNFDDYVEAVDWAQRYAYQNRQAMLDLVLAGCTGICRNRLRLLVKSSIATIITSGVQCKKDNSVLDEIPGAYKDIDSVMANQDDLVEVVHTLKQIITIKG